MKKLGIFFTALCLIVSCGKSNSEKNDFDPKPIDPKPVDPNPVAHKIGEFYQGGVIFWIDTTKQHGLIAATHDQGTGIWATREYNTGATLDGVGAGKTNTEKIINTFGSSLEYAAYKAASCTDGGYNDWYLPSKTELDLMLKQSKIIGGFGSGYPPPWYWSSNEAGIGLAWAQRGDGIQNTRISGQYSYYANVRAIRSF